MVSGAAISSRGLPSALIPNAISTSPVAGWPARAVAPGGAGGDGAAVPAGLSAAQIVVLLECHPAAVRRWIGRFNSKGAAGWPACRGAGGRRWAGGG